jgi:UDPglucose 6-dehydrogenase
MIGIIGLGFVGSAIYKTLKHKEIENIICYDKFKNGGIGKLSDCLNTEMIFVCLPTLFDRSKNEYNMEAINENLKILNNENYDGLVIIKSTVTPGTCNSLSTLYQNLNICHNPEFLSAKTAYEDFLNQKHIIIGKSKNCKNLEKLLNFYKKYWPGVHISDCDSDESETVKIFCNSFYSVKIQFFNELYLLCQKDNINFNKVKNMMIGNGWINPMHTNVPGSDGKLSYGGACFPKDTKALLQHLVKNKIPNKVLEATVKERDEMRND